MKIIVEYGVERYEKDSDGSTMSIKDVMADREIRDALGYDEEVNALILGVVQEPSAIYPIGETLSLETRIKNKY